MEPIYDFPNDLDEAQRQLGVITFEAQSIQDQLSDRDRRGPDGERMNEHDYWAWRSKAVVALRHLRDEQRELKWHIKRLNVRSINPAAPNLTLVDDLVRAYRDGDVDATGKLLATLAENWVPKAELMRR